MTEEKRKSAIDMEAEALRQMYRDILASPQSKQAPQPAPTLTIVDFSRGRREMVEGDV